MTGAVTETLTLVAGRESLALVTWGIELPRRGHRLCPFPAHQDRRPSWRWDHRRGAYFCSCGSGSLIDVAIHMGIADDPLNAAQVIRDVYGLPQIGQRRQETGEQRAERERRQAEALAQAQVARERREAEHAEHVRRQAKKALRLWLRASGATGTIVETYLRGRGITCPLPETVRFLPPDAPGHHPAMVAPFGLPFEFAPGKVRMPPMWLKGVHVTLLQPNGSGKAVNRDGNSKLTVGLDHDAPIVLFPPNDLGGLVIAEGTEDALSAHQATGLGAWAAGTANRLPGLAEHVPACVEAVTVIEDDDPAGRRFSRLLAERLHARGIEVSIERKEGAHGEAA